MKAIMISIKPKWVAKILNGEKTIEIRKTCPAIFKHLHSYEGASLEVYIYCTKDNHQLVKPKNYDKYLLFTKGAVNYSHEQTLNGKVVAKFTLNKVEEIEFIARYFTKSNDEGDLLKNSCLSLEELNKYLDTIWHTGKRYICGYAWHISNLEIFDRPKELCEFNSHITRVYINNELVMTQKTNLSKAPQSWCYVEDLL